MMSDLRPGSANTPRNVVVRASLLPLALLLLAVRAAAAPPPPVPGRFDRATVRRLVDTIEEGRNATVLKFGYFAHRSAHPLPLRDGLALVSEAVTSSAEGSRRWFCLSAVAGFAGLHIGADTAAQGCAFYADLFTRADRARLVDAAPIVERAVYEMIAVCASPLGATVAESTDERGPLPAQALRAMLTILPETSGPPLTAPWATALRQVGGAQECMAEIRKAAKDPRVATGFRFLRMAVPIADVAEPEAAIVLLEEGRRRQPPAPSEDLVWLYSTLADLYKGRSRLREAVAVQEECVQRTGRGYARLALLHQCLGESKSFDVTLDRLMRSDAPEQEVVDAAALLASPQSSEDPDTRRLNTAKAVELLSAFLTTRANRRVLQELRARLLLGGILVGQGKTSEARSILAADHLNSGATTPEARSLFERATRMRQRILHDPPPPGSLVPDPR